VTMLIGLMVSLVFKRRRVWFRMRAVPAGRDGDDERPPTPLSGVERTVVEVGGLARTDQAGYGEEFASLAVLPAVTGGNEQR
jgi:cytochrome c biogenesis protein